MTSHHWNLDKRLFYFFIFALCLNIWLKCCLFTLCDYLKDLNSRFYEISYLKVLGFMIQDLLLLSVPVVLSLLVVLPVTLWRPDPPHDPQPFPPFGAISVTFIHSRLFAAHLPACLSEISHELLIASARLGSWSGFVLRETHVTGIRQSSAVIQSCLFWPLISYSWGKNYHQAPECRPGWCSQSPVTPSGMENTVK